MPYADDEGVYVVRYRIEDAHKEAAGWCDETWGNTFVRIEAPHARDSSEGGEN